MCFAAYVGGAFFLFACRHRRSSVIKYGTPDIDIKALHRHGHGIMCCDVLHRPQCNVDAIGTELIADTLPARALDSIKGVGPRLLTSVIYDTSELDHLPENR